MLQRAHELLPPKPPRSRQAVRWHVGESAVLSLMGEPCVRKSCDKNGFVFETLSEPKRSIPLTFEEFDLLKDGYEFDIDPIGATPGKAAAVLKSDEQMIADLPEEERELVKNKLIAVKEFLAMQARSAASRYRHDLAPLLVRMQERLFASETPVRGGKMGEPPFTLVGPKRFLEWVDAYLEMGPLGLVNQYHLCGRRDDRYAWEERLVLMDYVYRYLSREAPTIADLWRDMEEEFAKLMVPPEDWPLADKAMREVHDLIVIPPDWRGAWRQDLVWRGFSIRRGPRRIVGENGKPVVCFTGAMPRPRKTLISEAEAAGWDAVDDPHSKIDVLVAADPNGKSAKLSFARKNGIPVLTFAEWGSLSPDGEIVG